MYKSIFDSCSYWLLIFVIVNPLPVLKNDTEIFSFITVRQGELINLKCFTWKQNVIYNWLPLNEERYKAYKETKSWW